MGTEAQNFPCAAPTGISVGNLGFGMLQGDCCLGIGFGGGIEGI